MSGKQMKRLRRAAKGLAASIDQGGRKITERSLYAQEHKREAEIKEVPTFMGEAIAAPEKVMKTYAVTAINRPDSLRGIFRTIKKGIKSGQIPKMPAQGTEILAAHEGK